MSLKICVKSSEVMSGLSSLYANQQLVDIRVVGLGGHTMAHKLVLAAVSDKFREMISTDTAMDSNTGLIVLVFADIPIDDIKTIIDCIYFGHQNIESNRFKELSKIGQYFGIKLTTAVSAALELRKPSVDGSMDTQWPFGDSAVGSEQPMDLSVCPSDYDFEDNIQKVIDSVALNGPQEAAVRRRKQSDPKPSYTKVVRFEESFDDTDQPLQESLLQSQPISFVTKDKPQISDELSSYSLAETMSHIQLFGQTSTPNNNESKIEDKFEVKIGANHLLIPTPKPKSVAKTPKGLSISEDQLKDCCVCGKPHTSHKQLILHLNKEHKTNDCFKCSVCGKEQKYAKTFAVHSIQCKITKV